MYDNLEIRVFHSIFPLWFRDELRDAPDSALRDLDGILATVMRHALLFIVLLIRGC
jgi:hypothetical protein